MTEDARAAREAGFETVLLHGQEDQVAFDAFDRSVAAPQIFDGRLRGAAAIRTLVGDVDVVHAHFWGHVSVLTSLCDLAPTVATCHLPVCPNGARYHYRHERGCDRAVGAVCATRGFLVDGCGHTADLKPFSWPAMIRSIARTRSELRALRRCERVIAPSAWQRDRLERDGIEQARIMVHSSRPAPLVPNPRPQAPAGAPVLLMLSRLMRFKGAHHLVQAAGRMHHPCEVWLAGEGPDRDPLETLAVDLGVAIRFLGPLDAERREAAFAAAAAVVVPSLCPETFGLVGPEAALRGVPTVAYAHSGILDWLDPAAGAVGVAPGDIDGLAAALDGVLEAAHPPLARVGAMNRQADLPAVYAAVIREHSG